MLVLDINRKRDQTSNREKIIITKTNPHFLFMFTFLAQCELDESIKWFVESFSATNFIILGVKIIINV